MVDIVVDNIDPLAALQKSGRYLGNFPQMPGRARIYPGDLGTLHLGAGGGCNRYLGNAQLEGTKF